jgi:hypothetical protein
MSLLSFLGLDGRARSVSKTEPLPVDIGSSVNIELPATLEIANDQGNPIPVSGPLTDTQLRAAAVPVAPNIQRGAGNVTAETTRVVLAADGPTVTALANIDGKTPALQNGAVPFTGVAVDAFGNGTREYNFAQGTRTAVGATSSAAVALGTLGPSREVMLIASTRCFVRFGGSGVTAAAASDANVLALPSDAMFHLRLPAGVTHLTVIRDTADGFLRAIPVV